MQVTWEFLLSFIGQFGFVALVGYLLRDAIAKFFSKIVEQRFEKKLEAFRGEMRDNERELDHIRSSLVSLRTGQDTILQSKRLESAETLMRARHLLSQLNMAVEYMKLLNTEEIMSDGDNPKIIEFINALLNPIDIDEKIKSLKEIDKTLPRLYMSEKSLKAFDAYEGIMLGAAFMMKAFSVPLRDKDRFFKQDGLSELIIQQLPNSKESFEQYGEKYAYFLSSHFHNETLRLLRHEVSGVDFLEQATKSIETAALDSRKAHLNVRKNINAVGLSPSLIKELGCVEESAPVVAKA
jgi:hypothetical protein